MTRLVVGGHELARLRAENVRLRDELAVERYRACHDVLTGLPNRRDLYERVRGLPAGPLVGMMLDLDGFKPVNDEVGHRAGDRVLFEVGRRLWSGLGGQWLVARLGGDEFTAVRPGPVSEPALLVEATDLARVVAAPIAVEDRELSVGCSVGVATTDTVVPLAVLLGRADAALARSKATGGPVVWHPRLDDDSRPGTGVRPVVRTRDLRPARYGDVSMLAATWTTGAGAAAVGRAHVPTPREGGR